MRIIEVFTIHAMQINYTAEITKEHTQEWCAIYLYFHWNTWQVDSTSCLCRVDARDKKFIPVTKLCIQSNIIQPSKHNAAATSPATQAQESLLPGLPDDLAIACLVRVPRAEHHKLRHVCKRWQRLLIGNYFYSLRQSLGIAEEWIYIIKRDKDGHISWDAFDPISQQWQTLPPIPVEYSEAVGFGCAVLAGHQLYMFGGKDPVRGSMRRVIYYNARTNKWHRAPDMLRRRHLFGSCVLNNCLYVAGGETQGAEQALKSAEVYDPIKNRWFLISDMSTSMIPFISVVYKGRWFIKGLGPHRQVLSEVYYPEANAWLPVFDGMVSGWRNPCTCLNGMLYALECRDGCKLRVYDGASDSWIKCMDSKLHLGSSRALEAAALFPINGKLCIIRNNMSITLVDVAGAPKKSSNWETLAGYGPIKTFVTNLWSSLAGRRRLQSHIVHCQVLKV